jgi:RNA polymerase sigma factor (sigma-70 family)
MNQLSQMYILVGIICGYLSVQSFAFINQNQWTTINRLLVNKNTDAIMRNKLNQIIYTHYHNNTRYIATVFKQKHHYYLKNIQQTEVNHYAYVGLMKAIKKYNGRSNFYKYAEIYIQAELLKSITELSGINILPHKMKTMKMYKSIVKSYKVNVFSKVFSNLDEENEIPSSLVDLQRNSLREIKEIIEIINNMPTDLQQTTYYKYGNDLETPITQREVSNLMDCSTETVRRRLNRAYNILKKDLKTE